MGYRAHICKKKVVEYDEMATFNWTKEELYGFLNEHGADIIEEEHSWEMEADSLADAKADILENCKEDEKIGTNGYTVKDVVEWIDCCLEINAGGEFSDVDYVYVEWF